MTIAARSGARGCLAGSLSQLRIPILSSTGPPDFEAEPPSSWIAFRCVVTVFDQSDNPYWIDDDDALKVLSVEDIDRPESTVNSDARMN